MAQFRALKTVNPATFADRSVQVSRAGAPALTTYNSSYSLQFFPLDARRPADLVASPRLARNIDAALEARRRLRIRYSDLNLALTDALAALGAAPPARSSGKQSTEERLFSTLRTAVAGSHLRRYSEDIATLIATLQSFGPSLGLLVHGFAEVREIHGENVRLRFDLGRLRREFSVSDLASEAARFDRFVHTVQEALIGMMRGPSPGARGLHDQLGTAVLNSRL